MIIEKVFLIGVAKGL